MPTLIELKKEINEFIHKINQVKSLKNSVKVLIIENEQKDHCMVQIQWPSTSEPFLPEVYRGGLSELHATFLQKVGSAGNEPYFLGHDLAQVLFSSCKMSELHAPVPSASTTVARNAAEMLVSAEAIKRHFDSARFDDLFFETNLMLLTLREYCATVLKDSGCSFSFAPDISGAGTETPVLTLGIKISGDNRIKVIEKLGDLCHTAGFISPHGRMTPNFHQFNCKELSNEVVAFKISSEGSTHKVGGSYRTPSSLLIEHTLKEMLNVKDFHVNKVFMHEDLLFVVLPKDEQTALFSSLKDLCIPQDQVNSFTRSLSGLSGLLSEQQDLNFICIKDTSSHFEQLMKEVSLFQGKRAGCPIP